MFPFRQICRIFLLLKEMFLDDKKTNTNPDVDFRIKKQRAQNFNETAQRKMEPKDVKKLETNKKQIGYSNSHPKNCINENQNF